MFEKICENWQTFLSKIICYGKIIQIIIFCQCWQHHIHCNVIDCYFASIQTKNITDPLIYNTVDSVAQQISEVAGVDNVHVFVIDAHVVNAFATLNNRMFFYNKLIRLLPHVGQLAGVVAHEMGHIASSHMLTFCGEMPKITKFCSLSAISSTFIGAWFKDSHISSTLLASSISAQYLSMCRFSRCREREADSCGVNYLKKLGWSTYGLPQALSLMRDMRGEMMEATFDEKMLTHPLTYKRLQFLTSASVTNWRQKNPNKGISDKLILFYKISRAKIIAGQCSFKALKQMFGNLYKKNDIAAAWAYFTFYKKMHDQINMERALKKIKTNLPRLELHQQTEYLGYVALAESKMLLNKGEKNEAYEKLKLFYRSVPHNVVSKITFAQCVFNFGKFGDKKMYQQAINELKAAKYEQASQFPVYYQLLAKGYGLLKKPVHMLNNLAQYYLLIGDFTKTMEFCTRALELVERYKTKGMQQGDLIPLQKSLELLYDRANSYGVDTLLKFKS